MGTSDAGETLTSNIILGRGILADFGTSLNYVEYDNPPYDFAIRLIDVFQPILWSAQGKWEFQNQELVLASEPGVAGHSVVSYGYDTLNQMLCIALGWGYGWPSKYVAYAQYTGSRFIYTGTTILEAGNISAPAQHASNEDA